MPQMTVIGIHNVFDWLTRYTRTAFSAEGGLSLIWMNALLLVPVVFAAFFYPVAAALIAAAVGVVAIGAAMLARKLRG